MNPISAGAVFVGRVVVPFNWEKLDGAAVRPGRSGLLITLSVKN